MTRVAFTVFGGDGWTGGINYLRNLVSALAELPDRPVEALLFVAPEAPRSAIEVLRPYLAEAPVIVEGWSKHARLRRLLGSSVLQRDYISLRAFRERRIDVVFQHAAWYGLRFDLPTLAWIADFQHRHLPQMFSRSNRLKRDFGYWALSHCADAIMVSSEDARMDCAAFFPASLHKLQVLPFCVAIDELALHADAAAVARRHHLPERFIYMPNQFWKHKNHLTVIEALCLLKKRGSPVVLAASGNPVDGRNPDHPRQVLTLAEKYGLSDSFRFLGMVPYEDIMPLMRASLAVINPSLFEGWSTTVEEAKALGVPLLLSDLAVHREQTRETGAKYFSPMDARAMADVLASVWSENARPPQRQATEAADIARYREQREFFARCFSAMVAGLSPAAVDFGATADRRS